MTRQVKSFCVGTPDVGGHVFVNSPVAGTPGAEASAFLARTSGLDGIHQTAYVNLINGLVDDGVWPKLDALYIYATQNSTTALLNLVSSNYTCVPHGSPTFTADRGYTGVDGSTTVFLDPQLNPGDGGTYNFVRNSCHVSAWSLNSAAGLTGSSGIIIGIQSGSGDHTNVIPRYQDGNSYYRIMGSNTSGVSNSDGRGHYLANRSSSTQLNGYRNAISALPTSDSSFAITSNRIYILAQNDSGNAATGFGGQVPMASIGGSLSSTDMTNFYNRLLTYMRAVGVPGPEAADFLARTSGLDATHQSAYIKLINGLVDDGLWSKLDALYITATQDSTTALLNLVSSSYNITKHGTPTFTADRGFTGTANSSTIYLATGFNPSTASSPKFTQNSAHLSVWNLTDPWAAAPAIGHYDSNGAGSYLTPRDSGGGNGIMRINSPAQSDSIANPPTTLGHELATRTNSTTRTAYRNAAVTQTNNNSSIAVLNSEMYALGANGNGTPNGCDNQHAAYSIGGSLSSTDVSNFYSRMRTYMTTVGVP